MGEIIRAGTVADFNTFIEALRFEESPLFPKDALFLAEEFPQQVIREPKKRKQLLCFALLGEVSAEDRLRYTSGRIFTKEAELRWEKKGEKSYHVVYCGPSTELEGMNSTTPEDIPLDNYDQVTKHYYLFGTRVKDELRERMQITADDSVGEFYAEARIPRLLHYPVKRKPADKGERVRLEVLEYCQKDTTQVMFYRFQGLELAE